MFIGCGNTADKENWVNGQCQPGKYFIVINVNWKSFVKEFSLSVYGPSKCSFTECNSNDLPPNFTSEIFLQHAINNPEKRLTKMSNGNIYFDKFDFGNGFGYIYFENKEISKQANITADMSKSRNI